MRPASVGLPPYGNSHTAIRQYHTGAQAQWLDSQRFDGQGAYEDADCRRRSSPRGMLSHDDENDPSMETNASTSLICRVFFLPDYPRGVRQGVS